MEVDWPYTQKARQQYHKEGSGLESPGQEIKRKTKKLLGKSQREKCGKKLKYMDRDQEACPPPPTHTPKTKEGALHQDKKGYDDVDDDDDDDDDDDNDDDDEEDNDDDDEDDDDANDDVDDDDDHHDDDCKSCMIIFT